VNTRSFNAVNSCLGFKTFVPLRFVPMRRGICTDSRQYYLETKYINVYDGTRPDI